MALDPMTDDERDLWEVLDACCRGRRNATRTERLAARLGWSARYVRRVKRSLVIRHHKPIGSATGDRPALYVVVDQAEKDASVRQLDNRLKHTYALRRALSGASIEDLVRQGVFDFARSQ
jgi:hypothetical protein